MVFLAVFNSKSNLYKYFGDIIIGVSEKTERGRVVIGCADSYEDKFYKGILEMDLDNPVMGFKTVEEVEEHWLNEFNYNFLVFDEEDLIVIPHKE